MVKTNRVDAKRFKYLRYWWLADSEIDPAWATEEYFCVFYDDLGRYIFVERYGADHRLISQSRFVWEGSKLVRTEAYGPGGEMEYYNVYRYDPRENLLGVEHYSPDGVLLRIETEGM